VGGLLYLAIANTDNISVEKEPCTSVPI